MRDSMILFITRSPISSDEKLHPDKLIAPFMFYQLIKIQVDSTFMEKYSIKKNFISGVLWVFFLNPWSVCCISVAPFKMNA